MCKNDKVRIYFKQSGGRILNCRMRYLLRLDSSSLSILVLHRAAQRNRKNDSDFKSVQFYNKSPDLSQILSINYRNKNYNI